MPSTFSALALSLPSTSSALDILSGVAAAELSHPRSRPPPPPARPASSGRTLPSLSSTLARVGAGPPPPPLPQQRAPQLVRPHPHSLYHPLPPQASNSRPVTGHPRSFHPDRPPPPRPPLQRQPLPSPLRPLDMQQQSQQRPSYTFEQQPPLEMQFRQPPLPPPRSSSSTSTFARPPSAYDRPFLPTISTSTTAPGPAAAPAGGARFQSHRLGAGGGEARPVVWRSVPIRQSAHTARSIASPPASRTAPRVSAPFPPPPPPPPPPVPSTTVDANDNHLSFRPLGARRASNASATRIIPRDSATLRPRAGKSVEKASVEVEDVDEELAPSIRPKKGAEEVEQKKEKSEEKGKEKEKKGRKVGENENPIVSTTLWEDERTVVMQVIVDGHVVARRADNDWINSTKLLNMANLTRGKRDMYLKNEPERTVFRRGAVSLKGVWLPIEAAAKLARSYDLYDSLYPLFEPNIRDFLYSPVNRERTDALIRASRQRELLTADKYSGKEEQEHMVRRSAALQALLKELEEGLLLTQERPKAPSAAPSTSRAKSLADALQDPRPSFPADALRPDGTLPSVLLPVQPTSTSTSAPSDIVPSVRRASLIPGFTHDFRAPVTFVDNPTPTSMSFGPEAAFLRRRSLSTGGSALSVTPEGDEERQLAPLMEDGDEMNDWTPSLGPGRRRHPVAGQRRASAPPAPGFDVDEYGEWSIAPEEPQPVFSQTRSHSLPTSFDGPHTSLDAHGNAIDSTDYSSLLASLHALSAPSYQAAPLASLSTAPTAPISRFQATRLSIDSATDSLHSHSTNNDGNVVAAPQAVPGFQEYSWMPSVAGGAQITQHYTDEALEAILSATSPTSSSLEQSASGTPIAPNYSQHPTSLDNDPYAFPSSTISVLPRSTTLPPSLDDFRPSSQRVLADLDARDSPISFLATSVDGVSAVPLSLPLEGNLEVDFAVPRLISKRRRASFPLVPVENGGGYKRASSPRMRRDSLIGAGVEAMSKSIVAIGSAVEGGERAPKRRRCDAGGEVGGEMGYGGNGAMDIEA